MCWWRWTLVLHEIKALILASLLSPFNSITFYFLLNIVRIDLFDEIPHCTQFIMLLIHNHNLLHLQTNTAGPLMCPGAVRGCDVLVCEMADIFHWMHSNDRGADTCERDEVSMSPPPPQRPLPSLISISMSWSAKWMRLHFLFMKEIKKDCDCYLCSSVNFASVRGSE